MQFTYCGDRAGLSPSAGTSLIELLAVLAVLALLAGIGAAPLRDMLQRTRGSAQMLELHGVLSAARQHATAYQTEVTVCGALADGRCASTWDGHPTIVFVDHDADRRLDAGEQQVLFTRLTAGGQIRWRASGGRSYLRFRPDGSVREYGSFTWCSRDGVARHARQIYLSATGRPRSAIDRNGDGVVDGTTPVSEVCAAAR